MWDKFILRQGFKNVAQGGRITGFQFKIHIPYYRAIWVSQCFQDFSVRVDGVFYPLDKISLKIEDRIFTWAQVDKAVDVFWHYGAPATIIVEKPGGLETGLHKVECGIHYERSYSLRPEDDKEGITAGGGAFATAPAKAGRDAQNPMARTGIEWHACSLDMVLVQ
ncbi:MAG: D-mannonate dehydratase [Acidobacteria bacterium]|jgi:hypothetical protein|nr:D-mannonate dehydratase [Acidobacteriota bacterium]